MRPEGRPTSFHGDPLVTDSLILIGSDVWTPENRLNHVWAFTHGGAVRWKTAVQGGIVSDIVRTEDRVIAITRTDSLLCLGLAEGRRIWSFAADADASEERFLFRSPTVAGQRAFVGDMEGRVHALDVDSGHVLWTRVLASPISGGILAIGDELLVADADGSLHRLDQATGKERAAIPLGTVFQGPPVAIGDSLVLLAGDDAIACLELGTGRVRWKHEARLSSSRPYVWRGSVLIATVKGDLTALRARDGVPLWTHPFQGIIRGIGHDDRTLYLGTQEGMLYAYRPSPTR